MQNRALETRQRLLKAAALSLAEDGFAKTTTQAVVKRAGATRGTLLHHFPNREDLLIASVEFVLDENVKRFNDSMEKIKGKNLTLKEITVLLWKEYWTDDGFYAWLELVVASRTDKALNEKVREMEGRWLEQFSSVFKSFFSKELEGVYLIFVLLLNSLSIEKIRSSPEQVEKAFNAILEGVDFTQHFFLIHPDKSK